MAVQGTLAAFGCRHARPSEALAAYCGRALSLLPVSWCCIPGAWTRCNHAQYIENAGSELHQRITTARPKAIRQKWRIALIHLRNGW